MEPEKAIDTLKALSASVEWDFPLDYAAAIDAAISALEAQTITDDQAFMTHLICEICDYAVRNEMEPDDTMRTICNNLLAMLEISTFNGWGKRTYDT